MPNPEALGRWGFTAPLRSGGSGFPGSKDDSDCCPHPVWIPGASGQGANEGAENRPEVNAGVLVELIQNNKVLESKRDAETGTGTERWIAEMVS